MHSASSDYDAIVQLTGGFGNQLFQYALGMQLEVVHGRKVAYDIEFYRQSNSIAHNRLRLVDLGFDVPTIIGRPKSYEMARRLKWMPWFVQQKMLGMTYVKCPATRYAPTVPKPGLTYFAGLWHSPKYFDAIAGDVRRAFRERLLAGGDGDGITRTGTVGFHVRRGDYLAHKQSYNLDYRAYLEAACATLAGRTGRSDWAVSVYTDDPAWCEANLARSGVEIKRGGGMLDDFVSLMQCEHLIISNSTFAWWAAFLGRTDNGLVLAPGRWHAAGDSAAAQVLCDDWIVVADCDPVID